MKRSWEPAVWALVADGERARVMVPDATEGHFHTQLWLGVVAPSHCPPPLRDHPAESGQDAFIADVARRLDEEAAAGAFDKLVLMAPGYVLNGLRAALAPHVRSRLVGAVDAPCAGVDDSTLSRQLSRYWMAPAEAV